MGSPEFSLLTNRYLKTVKIFLIRFLHSEALDVKFSHSLIRSPNFQQALAVFPGQPLLFSIQGWHLKSSPSKCFAFRTHLSSAPQGGQQSLAQLKGYPQHQCDLTES